ncbi:putative membrane protein [Peptoniphilus sp. ING2-D1G]|nr:putative membrane protein [Peptoniphilus sp. ING2-D1G]
MQREGIVVKVVEDNIEITTVRPSACGESCETCSAKCAESKTMTQTFPNTINAEVGDRVVIEVNDKNYLKYILLVYAVPLVFFIAGVFFSSLIIKGDHRQILSFFIGLIAMATSYLIIKKIDDKYTGIYKSIIDLKRY